MRPPVVALRGVARHLALCDGSGPSAGSASRMRHMSIMDRYRRLRPAPEPKPDRWAVPSESSSRPDGFPVSDIDGSSMSKATHSNQKLPEPPKRPKIYATAPVPAEAQFTTWQEPVQPANPQSLTIGLAGPPNAGKSSLMNAILDCPLSAVSPKVNTTRDGVKGITTIESSQLVFIDAPGIVPSQQRKTNKDLVVKAWRGYQECEICLLVIDVVKRPTQEVFDVVRRLCPREDIGEAEMRMRRKLIEGSGAPESWLPRRIPGKSPIDTADRPPVVLVLNKIDKASEFRWVQSREHEFRAHGIFKKVFYVSAKKKQGLWKLTEYLKSQCKPRPWTYPADLRTTLSYVEQVEHQINFHLFAWFNKDVPYKIQHQTVGWTPRLDGSLLVEHELIVEDSVVARMVLGVRNTIIARLRDQVSYKLKKMWGVDVEVHIWVRALRQRLSEKDRIEQGMRPHGR